AADLAQRLLGCGRAGSGGALPTSAGIAPRDLLVSAHLDASFELQGEAGSVREEVRCTLPREDKMHAGKDETPETGSFWHLRRQSLSRSSRSRKSEHRAVVQGRVDLRAVFMATPRDDGQPFGLGSGAK